MTRSRAQKPGHSVSGAGRRERAAGRFVAGLIILAGLGPLADQRARAAEIEVTVEGGRLSLTIEETPLVEVLEAIGAAAGFAVVTRGELGKVTARRVTDQPLERGIRRLVGPHSLLMRFTTDPAGGRRLEEVRVQAATAGGAASGRERRSSVGEVGDIRNYQQLSVLGSQERVAAVRDLARQRDDVATDVLAEALVRDGNAAVRRVAAGALASRRGSEAALVGLQGALGDPERTIRIQAMRGLRLHLGEQSVPLLADVLRDDLDPAVRRAAVQLIAGLEGDAVRQALEQAASDPDETVRRAAEAALSR